MPRCVIDESETIELPIDGTLDLHTFHPRDVKPLVQDYLAACRAKGIYQVRIIHGKGTGSLRRSVHAVLSRLDYVNHFQLPDLGAGSWGATLVELTAPAQKS